MASMKSIIGFLKDIFDFARQPLDGRDVEVERCQAIEEGTTARTPGLGEHPYLIYRASSANREIRVNTLYDATDNGFVTHIGNYGGYDARLCATEDEYRNMDPMQVDYAAYNAYMTGAR